MKITPFFSTCFSEARERFLECAGSIGAFVEELPIDACGPGGERLAISIAWLGSRSPDRVLLHCSGLHGVEGFVGSALQLHQLQEFPEKLPPSCAVVMIHVVNPYGMAWVRRMNENNVDLNRNFQADGEFTGVPPIYHCLNKALNLNRSSQYCDFFYLNALWCVFCHGRHECKQAVGQGQHEYPKGLFYGGKRLEQESSLVLEWVRENLSGVRRIVTVDVHSGLGPYAYDSLLVHYSSASDQVQVLQRRFGEQLRCNHVSGVAYRIKGGFLEALERTLPDAQCYSITQEYGTYGVLKVLKALRDENLYHHHAAPHVDVRHWSKQALIRTFCPDDPIWRQTVLLRGQQLVNRAADLAFSGSASLTEKHEPAQAT